MHTRTHVSNPQVAGEEEVLLPPGVRLKITDVLRRDEGLTIIVCEDDDDASVQPPSIRAIIGIQRMNAQMNGRV
jgi:hypothetical protein